MLTIPRRTRLSDGTGQRYLRTLHREEAQSLLRAHVIAVDETAGARIVSFRLSGVRVPTDIRPGSFGIRREHVPVGRQFGLSGGIIFSHQRNLHDEAQHGGA